MTSTKLRDAVTDVPSLRGVFLTAMPDCLLFDAWIRPEETWNPDEAASYFGDLVRANRQGLRALRSWSADMQVTIESADLLLVIRELRDDFVTTLAFDKNVPLGMVRLHSRRVMDRVLPLLPSVEASQRPRGVRVVEFLQKYAPDAHAVLNRVALRTGLSLAQLQSAGTLNEAQVGQVEDTVKDLLGLDTLAI